MALCLALPGPREQFEYMVIGTGSTAIAMLAFFLGCIVRFRWRK
jgi:hypothetical protein